MKLALILLLTLTACATRAALPTATSSPTSPPIVSASPSDPEMAEAISNARATLSDFIAHLASPNPTREFAALKVRFTPPGDPSLDIWCDDVTYESGRFTANIGDDIPSLRLSFGDRIEIATADIIDWMIVQEGKLIGGYTIRLAYSRMTPAEKQLFLEDAGYSIEEQPPRHNTASN
jgi:uncharacterized protein YegJ (DUF2314 family)